MNQTIEIFLPDSTARRVNTVDALGLTMRCRRRTTFEVLNENCVLIQNRAAA